MRLTTYMKITALVATAVSIVSTIGIIVAPFSALNFESLTYTGLILMPHAIVGLGLALAIERNRLPWLMRCGLLLDGAGLILAWYLLWGPGLHRADELVAGSGWAMSGWATLIMIVGVVLMQPANSGLARGTRRATIGLTIVLIGLLPVVLWFLLFEVDGDELLGRIFAVLAILTSCGLVASLVMGRLTTLSSETGVTDPTDRELTVVCPRCLFRQVIHSGGDACDECGLRISIEIP